MPPRMSTSSSLSGMRYWKGRKVTPHPTSTPTHSLPSKNSTPAAENTHSCFPRKQADGQWWRYIIGAISSEVRLSGWYRSQRLVRIFSQDAYPPSRYMCSLSRTMAHLLRRISVPGISLSLPSEARRKAGPMGTKAFLLVSQAQGSSRQMLFWKGTGVASSGSLKSPFSREITFTLPSVLQLIIFSLSARQEKSPPSSRRFPSSCLTLNSNFSGLSWQRSPTQWVMAVGMASMRLRLRKSLPPRCTSSRRWVKYCRTILLTVRLALWNSCGRKAFCLSLEPTFTLLSSSASPYYPEADPSASNAGNSLSIILQCACSSLRSNQPLQFYIIMPPSSIHQTIFMHFYAFFRTFNCRYIQKLNKKLQNAEIFQMKKNLNVIQMKRE